MRRIFDMRMNDGSRHFGDLPERYHVDVPEWEVLRDQVGALAGATLTGFATDHVTEAWIDFTWRGRSFSINNQHGQWWFFVDDVACPDELLYAVLDHFEDRLDPIRTAAPDGYEIGRARPDELASLPAIEDAAAIVFPHEDLQTSDGDGLSPAFFAEAHVLGRLWVARTRDAPIGFAAAILVDGAAHLHEMDVLPQHMQRGVGRALLEHVVAWAQRGCHGSLTLLTFKHLAFNGAFYRSAGFVELDDATLGPELAAMRRAEADKGLDLTKRVAMRRTL